MLKRGVLAVVLVCAVANVAHADDKQAAKESYTEGKRHYDLGEYAEALTAFKKAYLNYAEPVFLFNIALCYRQLGDRAGAIRSYKAYLDNWPKAPNRTRVEQTIADLQAEEAAAKATPPPTATAAAPPAAKPAATAAAPATTPAPAPPKPTTVASAPASKPSPAPTPSAGPKASEPRPSAAPAPAAVTPPPEKRRADYTEMVEVTPNFDQPSGSGPPLYKKWYIWTIVGIVAAAAVAAAIVVPLTQAPAFKSTLPDWTVGTSARPAPVARALEVRF